LCVGIDVGTTNTKVALVEVSTAQPRSVVSAPTPPAAGLGLTLRALLLAALDGAPAPDAVGIASMAETGVPLDRNGTPIGDWLRWDGHRGRAEADALARRLGWGALVGETGVRPSAKVPLATWAWLRVHRPDTWARMARWAGAADLVGLLLTGRLATDHTLAGRTMAYRLPGDRVPDASPDREPDASRARLPDAFDPDLLSEVGLRPEQVPDIVSAGVAGWTRDRAWPLRAGTPVVVAGHDHAVGAYAAGVRRPGDVADSVGTAEAIMSIVAVPPDPVEFGRAGMSAVVTVGQGWAILAGSSSAGAVVQWWLEHESGDLDADDLFGQALAVGGPSDVIVLPYLFGRQTPDPAPAARLQVLGRPGHSPAELTRAMLEGLCLQARWMVAEQLRLARLGGVEVVVLGGPVATNPAWTIVKSDVLPWSLRLVSAPEPVAAGAAMVAAERVGLIGAAPALEGRRAACGGHEYDRAFTRFVAAARAQSP
jgi:xylulokinase